MNTVWRAAQLLPCSVGCSPVFVTLYSVHIQLFQLNRGWSMFPNPSCSPILAAELQGEFLASKAPYPPSITQQHPDISAQEYCMNQEQGDLPWPHFLQTTGENRPEEAAPAPTQPSTGSTCPGGTTVSLNWSWILEAKLLCSHSTSIAAFLCPCPVGSHGHLRCPLPAQAAQEWGRQSSCHLSLLASWYPWLFRVPCVRPRAAKKRDTGLGELSVFYPTLPVAPHFPGYSYSQEVREAHSGGRVDTASRIHLPLINKGL